MLYKKEGYPEVSELVFCTVTKILPHAVFVGLDEYGNSGMIHISEIAPGRIRNMNEYVSVGKKIACKVLRLDLEKGHIDLSLRRVTEGQRRDKVNQLKKEQKAEKIVELLAHSLKTKTEELYAQITKNVFKDYEYLHEFFEDIVNGDEQMSLLQLPPKLEHDLQTLVTQKMAPSELEIKGVLTLTTFHPQGVERIRQLFAKMKDAAISFRYLGNSNYAVVLRGYDYAQLEDLLANKVEKLLSWFTEQGGIAKFTRS